MEDMHMTSRRPQKRAQQVAQVAIATNQPEDGAGSSALFAPLTARSIERLDQQAREMATPKITDPKPKPKDRRRLSATQCKAAQRMFDRRMYDLRTEMRTKYEALRAAALTALRATETPDEVAAHLRRLNLLLHEVFLGAQQAEEIAKTHKVTLSGVDFFRHYMGTTVTVGGWPTVEEDLELRLALDGQRSLKEADQILYDIRTFFEWVVLQDTLTNEDRVLAVLNGLPACWQIMDARVSAGDILAMVGKVAR